MEPKKFLLIDNDKAFNFLNRLTLKDHKVDCVINEALDGQEALDQLAAEGGTCPDVILLDINMPGVDGFEFLKEFEERNKCQNHSKIYMLTSSLRDEDRTAALSNRLVKGYFDKPLSTEHIEQIMAAV